MTSVIGQAPLFPLPDGALLPGELLPLRIFEPRYRQMMESVREKDGIIAIGTLLPGWEQAAAGQPPVADVVGVGRVVKDRLKPDGTSDIVLHGLVRGQITAELDGKPYRRALVLMQPLEALHAADAFRLRRRLLAGLARRVGGDRLGVDVTAGFDPGALVDRIASALQLQPEHRVAVLQALDPARRIDLLLGLLGDERHRERLLGLIPALSDFALTLSDVTP